MTLVLQSNVTEQRLYEFVPYKYAEIHLIRFCKASLPAFTGKEVDQSKMKAKTSLDLLNRYKSRPHDTAEAGDTYSLFICSFY